MSNLGRANPGNHAQLTDCVFSMTFVAFRRLSISVTDAVYTRHVTCASELVCCAGTVPVWKGAVSKLFLFGLYTCHQTEEWEVQADSAQNISTVDYLLRIS